VANSASAVLELTRDSFAPAIDGHSFAVVDFWAPWCAPCRVFAPVIAAAAGRHPALLFGKVNTEAEPELASYFGIRSIPTLMIFRQNLIVFAAAGALSAAALDEVLAGAAALDLDAVRREAAAALCGEGAEQPARGLG
jgi:thioredoxin 1